MNKKVNKNNTLMKIISYVFCGFLSFLLMIIYFHFSGEGIIFKENSTLLIDFLTHLILWFIIPLSTAGEIIQHTYLLSSDVKYTTLTFNEINLLFTIYIVSSLAGYGLYWFLNESKILQNNEDIQE